MLIPKTMSSIHDENILVSDKGNAQNGYVYNAASFRRYYASFPCYLFRTLCPRDADQMLGGSVFDQNSPVIPAHTQINAKFTRRPAEQLLNWMLPSNLDYDLGSRARGLDDGQRRSALNFTAFVAFVNTQYQITGMEVVIRDLYLQVRIERIDRVKRVVNFFFSISGDPLKVQGHFTRATLVKYLHLPPRPFYARAKSLPAHVRRALAYS